jgi:hypothetical protein
MLPSSPAFFSCLAHQVTRWSAARTSAGGSSRPTSAAFPESSAHRSTRASLAASSRRLRAASGATCMTARAIAARSPPGVSVPARSRTRASAARASSGVRSRVAAAMIRACFSRRTPDRNAALVPGSLTSRWWAMSNRSDAAQADSASAGASSSGVNSSQAAGIRAGPSSA